jgi:DNA sulfur modification protein DndB
MNEPSYVFPAIVGIQAGTQYFVSMVPLSILPKLFMFSEEELPAGIRAQRILNKARIPEICEYIIENPRSYVFSAITASVDGDVQFEPFDKSDPECKIGKICVPMSARFLINDGQHRKAAIEAALKKNPLLKYEDISVVLFSDMGLARSQQIFSDLNRYAIRPTKSLNILYDNRSEFSTMICEMADSLEGFKGWVEKERSTIPNRSRALFTLSGIYHGTEALLLNQMQLSMEAKRKLAVDYWSAVMGSMPDWQKVLKGVIKASALRKDSVSAHSIALIALGRIGDLILLNGLNAKERLPLLLEMDWSKKNPDLVGKIVIDDHISGTRSSTNALTEILARLILGDD